jgi:hypothetical protein
MVYATTTDLKGLHQLDIAETTKVLAKIRRDGGVVLPDTVDGRIEITYNATGKQYTMVQYWDGNEVARIALKRNALQGYLIELRRRRRAEPHTQEAQ